MIQFCLFDGTYIHTWSKRWPDEGEDPLWAYQLTSIVAVVQAVVWSGGLHHEGSPLHRAVRAGRDQQGEGAHQAGIHLGGNPGCKVRKWALPSPLSLTPSFLLLLPPLPPSLPLSIFVHSPSPSPNHPISILLSVFYLTIGFWRRSMASTATSHFSFPLHR